MRPSYACQLFDRCLADRRDEDWRELIGRLRLRIRGAIRAALGRCGLEIGEADMDELVQELYIRLLSPRRRRFCGRTDEELWAYLGRVIHSLTVDYQRSLESNKRRVWQVQERAVAPRARAMASPHPSPEERLLNRERCEAFLRRCLEVVRGEPRALKLRALGLAILGGWTSREITLRFRGLSVPQIDTLVHRLRRHLARDGIRLPRRLRSGRAVLVSVR